MVRQDRAGTRRQGVVTRWNDQKGFGFIELAAAGRRVFVHVSAVPRGQRPVDGGAVTYVEVHDERGWAGVGDARLASSCQRDRRSGGETPGDGRCASVYAAWFAALSALVVWTSCRSR